MPDTEKIPLKIGSLTKDQISQIFSSLPGELVFIDENDVIQFYTHKEKHIFNRKPEIIGTDVRDCHAESSYKTIDDMIAKFKSGEKDYAESWIQHEGMLVHIIYYAIRDDEGNYRGIAEWTQDINHVRELKGEQRGLVYR
jgi:uncharacterized protein